MKRIFALTALVLSGCISFAQEEPQSGKFLPGKWKVCVNTVFDTATACDLPYEVVTLLPAGRYFKEGTVLNNGVRSQIEGTWKFENQALTFDQDGLPGMEQNKFVKKIAFINKDLFYFKYVSTVESPGTVFYTWYRRAN